MGLTLSQLRKIFSKPLWLLSTAVKIFRDIYQIIYIPTVLQGSVKQYSKHKNAGFSPRLQRTTSLALLKENRFDFQVYWTQNTSMLNCLLDWVTAVNGERQKRWKYCRASLNSLSLEISGETVASFLLHPFCSLWSCPPSSLWLSISTLFFKTFWGHYEYNITLI